mmetsp:Transcript_19326/g.59662  ORF Transcript_19326/g.59662 Transcript_19326/m.59662 type:complete len:235 (-) Transcript_19326:428-1132(-)
MDKSDVLFFWLEEGGDLPWDSRGAERVEGEADAMLRGGRQRRQSRSRSACRRRPRGGRDEESRRGEGRWSGSQADRKASAAPGSLLGRRARVVAGLAFGEFRAERAEFLFGGDEGVVLLGEGALGGSETLFDLDEISCCDDFFGLEFGDLGRQHEFVAEEDHDAGFFRTLFDGDGDGVVAGDVDGGFFCDAGETPQVFSHLVALGFSIFTHEGTGHDRATVMFRDVFTSRREMR